MKIFSHSLLSRVFKESQQRPLEFTYSVSSFYTNFTHPARREKRIWHGLRPWLKMLRRASSS